MSIRRELCSRGFPLKARLRLFEASVSATLLYGSETWTMTARLERKLKTTQRRMLRWIIGVGRRKNTQTDQSSEETDREEDVGETNPSDYEDDDVDEVGAKEELESWVDWIKRATSVSEQHLANERIEDWINAQKRQKLRWAGHVARRHDSRWSHEVLYWKPENGRRRVGRPDRRWADCINAYFAREYGMKEYEWIHLAQCRESWKSAEDTFVRSA